MGSITAYGQATATSMVEAWQMVQEEDSYEKGHDPYNGGLNNCSLVKDVTHKLKEMSEDELVEWIENNCDKREAMGYCTRKPHSSVNAPKKTTVKFNPQKGTRKWVTEYIGTYGLGKVAVKAPTQTECIKRAREWVSKNGGSLDISIRKVLAAGNLHCATVHAKSTKVKGNPLGKYHFVGWAPY